MNGTLKNLVAFTTAMIAFSGCVDSHSNEDNPSKTDMCEKLPMQPDGIVRLSKIQVNPDYIDDYMKYAIEVGTVSLETEPGVLTMYAMADKENPCNITILETYTSREAYKSHIESEHFRKYKQGTLHMVDSLVLDDVIPLNPDNQLINFISQGQLGQ